jgi:3-hydroxyisobutyrate dehydrogenase
VSDNQQQSAGPVSTDQKPTEKVGFIGLGIMGRGMCHNLLKAGFDLTVWNRTPSKADELVAEGAKRAEHAADLASKCDIIITCVSDTPDVREVLLGEYSVMDRLRPDALVIDMSTISPQATREMAELITLQGGHMLDAPISGGSEGAAKGTLSIMVGGDKAQFERALPVFQAMGKTITHVGDIGAGQMVKLVNQILVVVNALAVSEALLFAQAGGVDLDKALQAVSGGAAGSWMLSNRGPQIIERDWRPGFTIDLQQKDLRLVLEAAGQLGVPTVATSLISNLYRGLQAQGLGGEGNHALVKALENIAGMQVGKSPSDAASSDGETTKG